MTSVASTLGAGSIAAVIFSLIAACGRNGFAQEHVVYPGNVLTISTTLDTTTGVTLTLPPPLKAPSGESGSSFTESMVRTLTVITGSGIQIAKFQLSFSKIEQKSIETGLDGVPRTSESTSPVAKNKKFVVLCEVGREAVESDAGTVSPQERELALRECTVANALVSTLVLLHDARLARHQQTISREQASALLGGALLEANSSATVSFAEDTSAGDHSFKLAVRGDKAGSLVGSWDGAIVQSKDELHIETNVTSSNEATQALGKSALKSVSMTKLKYVQDLSVSAK